MMICHFRQVFVNPVVFQCFTLNHTHVNQQIDAILYGDTDLVNTGAGNDFTSDSTRPLPESILSRHSWWWKFIRSSCEIWSAIRIRAGTQPVSFFLHQWHRGQQGINSPSLCWWHHCLHGGNFSYEWFESAKNLGKNRAHGIPHK